MSFKKWFSDCRDENYYTPDMPEVFKHETQYVFLADNLMQGKARHHKLVEGDAYTYLGKAFTKSATYGIMLYSGSIEPINPVYFEVQPNKEAAFIYGELYEVSPEVLTDLDYHQCNNLMTHRKKIEIVTQGNNLNVTAWTWLADNDHFNRPITANKLKPFTLREYLWNIPVIAWGNTIFA